jgi:hypothetical protein
MSWSSSFAGSLIFSHATCRVTIPQADATVKLERTFDVLRDCPRVQQL